MQADVVDRGVQGALVEGGSLDEDVVVVEPHARDPVGLQERSLELVAARDTVQSVDRDLDLCAG